MRIGVVVFPGSNCERDMVDAVRLHMKETVVLLWHNNTQLQDVDAILLPGGFSYGDYLRSGALASFSPIMEAIREFANAGKPVLGVCNGFQILTEAGLLPGVLVKNESRRFQCQHVPVRVENNQTAFSGCYNEKALIQLPIAHADGNYFADPETVSALEANQQVVLRYISNVNGSVNQIAGICNVRGNVVGMMPHPERSLWPSLLPEALAHGGIQDGCGIRTYAKYTLLSAKNLLSQE
jgi:phosphoribosylformylglycinamidine synthase subunit PurQ / glutaminase